MGKLGYGLLLLLLLAAQAGAETLRLCYDEQEGAVRETGFRHDPNYAVLQALERQTGVHFELESRAWRRCLAELGANQWDGAVAASFLPERQAYGVYPMKNGQPDPARRMGADSYSLYRLRGSPANWDGSRFSGITGLVGAQSGYSIIPQLQAAHLRVDSSSSSVAILLQKLQAGRIDAVALLTWDGDYILAQDPQLADHIERVDPPLVLRPHYLIFSKALVVGRPALAEKIWHALSAARDASGQ